MSKKTVVSLALILICLIAVISSFSGREKGVVVTQSSDRSGETPLSAESGVEAPSLPSESEEAPSRQLSAASQQEQSSPPVSSEASLGAVPSELPQLPADSDAPSSEPAPDSDPQNLTAPDPQVDSADVEETLPAPIPAENIVSNTTGAESEPSLEPEERLVPAETELGEAEAADTVAPDPAPSDRITDTHEYVLNKNTKKFHLPTCSSVKDMAEKNKLLFSGSREEVIEMGYDPCKKCKP